MNKHSKYKLLFDEMKDDIINSLSDLDYGWAMRKWEIQEETSIPMNILTVLLKELKHEGKVKILMIWSEETGLPNGSGYCLTHKQAKILKEYVKWRDKTEIDLGAYTETEQLELYLDQLNKQAGL